MGCDLCVTDLQDVRSAEQEEKRGERERRVWTARRVVVGRASHDELFFKIASTSPTTRKTKKPEILSLRDHSLDLSATTRAASASATTR